MQFLILGEEYEGKEWSELEERKEGEQPESVEVPEVRVPSFITLENMHRIKDIIHSFPRVIEFGGQDVYCEVVKYIESCRPR